MNVELLFGFATVLVVLILIRLALTLRSSEVKPENEAARPQPMRRAAGGARNARRRMRVGTPVVDELVENAPSEDEEPALEGKSADLGDVKLGAKKRAKLEAKAEKRVAREAAEREREDRKRKELLSNEESEKRREREREEELGREEAERKVREEKERRERDEYLKMKEAFSVEEEGFDAEETETENLLGEFVDRVKRSKVVILEDLADHFGMKTGSVVERIRELRTNGTLTGVIDDRGKFIYVSPSELEDVARFVRQRGRVSIAELAENSNRLINLNSGTNPEISVAD